MGSYFRKTAALEKREGILVVLSGTAGTVVVF